MLVGCLVVIYSEGESKLEKTTWPFKGVATKYAHQRETTEVKINFHQLRPFSKCKFSLNPYKHSVLFMGHR